MYNYYPQVRQVMPQYQPQMQAPQEERLYVPNEQAAEAYLMAPNSFVMLWDANKSMFYEKRTDQSGRPFPLRKFEFREVQNEPQNDEKPLNEQFVTRDEFNALIARLEPQKPKKGEKTNE